MAETQLREAFELMKQGEKNQAMMIVRGVLRENRQSVEAWWLMANLLDDEDKILKSLNQVLELNPDHRGARKKLAALRPDLAENLAPSDDKKKNKEDEVYWAKLNKKPSPKPMMGRSTVIMIILGGIGGLLLLATISYYQVVSPYLSTLNVEGPPPEEVVIIHFTAAFNGDAMTVREYTCSLYEDKWVQIIPEMNAKMLSQGVNPNDVTFDFSGLQVTEFNRSWGRITVDVSGNMIILYKGTRTEVSIVELTGLEQPRVELVSSDGRWEVCST